MTTYQTHDIPVRGGTLRVGEWAPDAPANAPVILAFHGITASHFCWPIVAERFPEFRFIAPDLRGRGRSNSLPAPYGFRQHAEDALAILDTLGIEKALLVGHSMGGFVAAVTAAAYPDHVSGVLLVDGGLPFALPDGADVETTVRATLGPGAGRLSMTFASPEAYFDFWKQHPSFVGHWSKRIEDYVTYDLHGEAPNLQPSTVAAAMLADAAQLYGGEPIDAAITQLPDNARMLWAPRGLLNETPGLYSPEALQQWRELLPNLPITEVPDTNHYTIFMTERGADAVASEIRILAR